MNVNNNNKEYSRITPGGNGYFRLKSTIQKHENDKNWSSMKLSAEDMITLYPEYEMGWFMLGIALLKFKNYNEALVQFNKALYLNPELASAYLYSGNANYYLQNHTQAVSDYLKALSKGINTHQLFYNLGNAYYKLNRLQEAINAYTLSLERCSGYHKAAYALFHIHYQRKAYGKAVSSLNPVIDREQLPAYLLAQAKLLYQDDPETGRHQLLEAHRLLSCAIDLNVDFGQAYYERAYINSKLKDLSGFSRDRKIAFALTPSLKSGHGVGVFAF